MANSTVFISASDARQNILKDIVVHDEARAIESAILDAVRNGYYQAVLTNGSPMTSSTALNVAIESIDTDSDQIYIPNHPFKNGDLVSVSSNTVLPAPLQSNTYYSIIYIDKDHVKLGYKSTASTEPRPAAVDFTAGVYNINVTNSGSGYITEPTVSIAPSPIGDNAVATATLYPWGSIDNILVVTPGQGYTNIPAVAVNSQGLDAAAGTVEFRVVGVSVATGGSDYRVGDVLTIVGGTGTSATATVTAVASGGAVSSVALGIPGLYSVLPTLSGVDTTVQPGGGTGCTLNISMGIGYISVANGGINYTNSPRVIIENGGGTNATATAIVNAGVVIGFTVTNAGSGYTSAPDIIITSGFGATARAILKPTSVGSIEVTNNGGNTYTEPPTVTIASRGSGVVIGDITMMVTSVKLTNSGRNYRNGDVLLIAGGDGTSNASILVTKVGSIGEIINYTLATSGSYTVLPTVVNNLVLGGSGTTATFDLTAGVETIPVVDGGQNYTAPPTIIITSINNQGGGASAIAVLDGDAISEIIVTSSGSGYIQPPLINITSGNSAIAVAKLTETTVANVVVDIPGSGYTVASVRFVGDGDGASGTVNLSGGAVQSITMVSNGSGYTLPPTVIIDGNGSGASAYAVLTPTNVNSITVVEPGVNFTSIPDVVVDGAALATASLSATGIARLEVTNHGESYTSQPTITFINDPSQVGNTIPPSVTAIVGYGVYKINVVKGGSGYSSAPLVQISSPQGLNPVTATATATIGSGIMSGTTVMSLYPESMDYWKVWKNQTPSDSVYTRPYADRMDNVVNYFVSMGYTINRQTNPATGNTIQWTVMW